MRLPLTLFLVLLVLALAQSLYYGPQLSDPVASSFDGAGNARGFQSRSAFLTTHLVVFGILALTLGGMPLVIGFIPTSLVNLPHRDYYLAPGRREESLAFVRRHMMWLAVATTAFLLVVMQLVFQANIAGTNRLPSSSMWALLGPYLAFVAVWCVRMFLRFKKPPSAGTAAAPAR